MNDWNPNHKCGIESLMADFSELANRAAAIQARDERIQRLTDLIGSLRCSPYGEMLSVRECIQKRADGVHSVQCSRCVALAGKEEQK